LEPGAPILPTAPITPLPPDEGQEKKPNPAAPSTTPPIVPPIPVPNRFQVARTNISHFASSNGTDSASLGRAISHYVSTSTGGARHATRRMGTSRKSSTKLLGILSNTIERGAQETLQELHLEGLVGLPIEEIFIGMIDYICPDGGTVDEGIARDAFIETIADLAENNITDFDSLTSDQMQTVFELYATHTIVNRLYNDIGMKAIQLPIDAHMAIQIQIQINDFVRRGVSDALESAKGELKTLKKESVHIFVNQVYEDAFSILQSLGEMEATAV
jgi:hypothetical protein